MSRRPERATPDRALVFEVIGDIKNFVTAANSLGLEWLTEDLIVDGALLDSDQEVEEEEDEEEGADDKRLLTNTLYVTMPSVQGLQRLIALWNRYSQGERKDTDQPEWWDLFGYLVDVRVWSARDRIDPTVSPFIEARIARDPNRPIRLELDLWYRGDPELRAAARGYVETLMLAVDGTLLDFGTIEEIEYQAALVELPVVQARALQSLQGPIADASAIMRVRPQSLYTAADREPLEGGSFPANGEADRDTRPAIAAILDGYPVQNHDLLTNRLDIEEVDVLGSDVPVSRRFHGTAMSSLILHGDLHHAEPPLTRTLKVVPILAAPQGLHEECTPLDKLPILMVHRAVIALVAGLNGGAARGENVVVINHSVCDQEAPFARRPTPWAKLLDFLAHKYRLLFIVSSGNNHHPFDLDAYSSVADLEAAPSPERQVVLLRSLERAKGTRSILSPAETLNGLTVGAVHYDGCTPTPTTHVEPFDPITGVVNICTAVGLGINRALKPDLVEAGGRQFVAAECEGGVVSVRGIELPNSGQLVAAPDTFGGSTAKTLNSTGTSNSAALVTRNSMIMADVLEELFQEDGEVWSTRPTRAVVMKALLSHGCDWGDTFSLLDAIYPPQGAHGWRGRRDTMGRFLGYGRADPSRLVSLDGSRITLLADDMIASGERHNYRIPVPRAMIENRETRRLVITLAWSSPTDPGTKRYRGVALDVVDNQGGNKFWKGVKSKNQIHPDSTRRGTLQHIVMEGENLMKLASGGSFVVGVQARAGLAEFERERVPYGMALTLEMAQPLRQDLNADVLARIQPKQRIDTPVMVRERVRR